MDSESLSISEDFLCSTKMTAKDTGKNVNVSEFEKVASIPPVASHDCDDDRSSHTKCEDASIFEQLDNTGLCIEVNSSEKIIKKLVSFTGSENSINLEHGDMNDRVQTPRIASFLNKTRVSSRSASQTESAVISASTENSSLREQQMNGSVGKPPRGQGSKTAKIESAAIADAIDWVQCDSCAKWRSFSTTSEKLLPEKWFCHLNTWDLRFNNCSAAEEVVKVEIPSKVTNSDENRSGSRKEESGMRASRGVRVAGRGRTRAREESHDNVISDEDGGSATRSFRDRDVFQYSSNRRKSGTVGKFTVTPVAAVNWVMCNKCKKWRKVPEYISMEVLPDKWFCSLNTWSVAFSRCSAKEEQDDVLVATESSDFISNNLTDNVSAKISREIPSRRKPFVNIPNSGVLQVPGGIRKVSWVQCERKNCKKWRKVPATIDTKLFPEKWFCEMNSWDMDVANCDAPEVSDDEDDYKQTADTRSQLILSNSKGPGALSYRRIIFGTDGKIRSCFSDKNRNGYGIFSFSETQKQHSGDLDDYFEPIRRVSYWWSGAYDESGTAYLSSKKFGSVLVCGDNISTFRNIPPSTTLLDMAQHMMPCPVQSCHVAWPKKQLKSWTRLNKMTIIQREKADCIAVRSCFLATTNKLLTLPSLQSILNSSRFLMEDIEASREFMDFDILKRTLRRLEERDLISVTLNSDGVLCFEMILRLYSHVACSEDGQHRPLKLRKFFSGLKRSEGLIGESDGALIESLTKKSNSSFLVTPNVYITHRFKMHSKYEEQL